MLKLISLVSSLVLSTNSVFAAEAKSKTAKTTEMRCEKLVGTSLTDFKAALVDNCNLDKPFSSSLSKVLNDEVYFYCCHKK